MKKTRLVTAVLLALTAPGFASTAEEYFDQGVKAYNSRDFSRAANLFRDACEGGVAEGCFHLGMMHEYGLGFAKNRVRAADFYAKACDFGYGFGCKAYAESNETER